MPNEIELAIKKAEETTGFEIPLDISDHVLSYTMRKFLNIIVKEEKPDGYFGILYQNELEDYFAREAISFRSERNRKESSYVLCV